MSAFATERQVAVWNAQREFDQGLPWGYGKSDAEIDAEVERRVEAWAAERAAEKARAA